MGLIKRIKFVKDTNGAIGLATLLFVLFPSSVTLGAFMYESVAGSTISPESAPTLAGIGIEYLWVIFALITAVSIFFWVVFGRAKPRTD